MLWIAVFLMQSSQLMQDPQVTQSPQSQADRVRAAMASSLEQQRESVKKQAQTAGARSVPWVSASARPPFSVRPPVASADCDPVPQPQLTQMIHETSHRIGVDAGLVREVARQESGFKPCAISAKGAEGLMQLMPVTQMQFSVSNPFDPQESLEAGSKLLKQLLERYHGNLPLALSAYNAGIGCVDRSGGVPDILETKNYVLSILSRASTFETAPLPDSLLAPPTGTGCQSEKSEPLH